MTTLVASHVDGEGTLRGWLNSLTGANGLVGPGNPLALGAHFHRLRSPARGSYAVLSGVGTPWALTQESVTAQTRISAMIYGITKERASAAAVAYANRLHHVGVLRPVYRTVQIVGVDAITGPVYLPDDDEHRYMVDADVYFTASAVLNADGSIGNDGTEVPLQHYTLVQSAPAATWSWPNPLGRPCTVEVFVGNTQVFTDVEVTTSTITITHPSPVSGSVVLS